MATPSVPTQLINGSTPYQALANGESIGISGNVTMVPGEASGKTFIMKTGTLATTAVTTDQVILTYTVTALKTFYLQYVYVKCRLDASITTGAIQGDCSLETPSGTKVFTMPLMNPTSVVDDWQKFEPPEPIPISAGTVLRVVCTPSSTTARTWYANFGGYEK